MLNEAGLAGKWSKGETLTMVLDCNVWRFDISKNKKHLCGTEIDEGKTYYPAVQASMWGKQEYKILV